MKLASTTRMVAVYVGGEHVIVVTGMLPTTHHRVEVRRSLEPSSPPIFEVVCWPTKVARATAEYVAYVRAALGPKAPALIVRDADGEHALALRELRLVAHDAKLAAAQPSPGAALCSLTVHSGDERAPPCNSSTVELWQRLVHEKPLKMSFSPAPEEAAGEWDMLRRPGLR